VRWISEVLLYLFVFCAVTLCLVAILAAHGIG
jgi:hypothetical protein